MPVKEKSKSIPRQRQLPGVQNTKIAAIENAALDYAEIRDKRQELSKQESDLKQSLLKLMHKLHKTEYRRNGIVVTVEVEEETVKVRVKSEKEPDEDDEDDGGPDGEEQPEEEESQAEVTSA
jgi:hypothetical protein